MEEHTKHTTNTTSGASINVLPDVRVRPQEREAVIETLKTAYEQEMINYEEYNIRVGDVLQNENRDAVFALIQDLPESFIPHIPTIPEIKIKEEEPQTRPQSCYPYPSWWKIALPIEILFVVGLASVGIFSAINAPKNYWRENPLPPVINESINGIATVLTHASTQQGELFTAPAGAQEDFSQFTTPSGVKLPNTSQVINSQFMYTLKSKSRSDWVMESTPDGTLTLTTDWGGDNDLVVKCVIQPTTQNNINYSSSCEKKM